MSGRCSNCAEDTVWDDSVGSSVCTSCGTLADPSQSVLASHLESYDSRYPTWTAGASTLKCIRSSQNAWALSGQGKEDRDRKNTFAIHTFIDTLCSRLSNSPVSSRARTIFDQAMSKGNYRWGRKAKLTAGASVAAALRESQKSDSLRDIAALLDESPISLLRAFHSVVDLLNLGFTSSDPGVHLTILQTHLLDLTTLSAPQSADPPLPKALISVIISLQPRFGHVMKTARSLSALVTRFGAFAHLPTPSTACAVYILALEGESRSPLPNCGVLAQALGSRFGIGQGVVMQRYRAIYDIIEEWIKEVPWLDDARARKTTVASRGKPGRLRSRKRTMAAKGLKDVIQFQDEILRKKLDEIDKVVVNLDLDENGNEEHSLDSDITDEVIPQSPQTNVASGTGKRREAGSMLDATFFCRPFKKRKTKHTQLVEHASQFLLDPVAHVFPSQEPSDTGLLAHLLTSDTLTLSHTFTHQPTRLQMLVGVRAGGEQAIADEELFEAGEFEALIRDEQEREIYSKMVNWDEVEDEREQRRDLRREQKERAQRKRERLEIRYVGEGEGSKRINMEALKLYMDPESCLDTLEDGNDGKDASFSFFNQNHTETDDPEDYDIDDEKGHLDECCADDGIEVEENWRPMSPALNFASSDQYSEP